MTLSATSISPLSPDPSQISQTEGLSDYIFPLEDLASQISYTTDRFQSKILLDHAGQKTILFAFAQGQELKTHTTPTDALLLVLEGECAFLFPQDEKEQTLKAGQIIRIPAQVQHALKAISDFKMVLIK
ncbi:cupin domain-containing protein [Rufibacter latericius]|uniref:Cupin domain-containing protein n=1 Tax=Rufibacter latericius TaxID=2487040 RepID=A0A3M9M860_9BACT|nr:cupin domain-containing protein [Rufibacter latericius]RNI21770.1 cupin domain-containing protein [Rufibacter latericius]